MKLDKDDKDMKEIINCTEKLTDKYNVFIKTFEDENKEIYVEGNILYSSVLNMHVNGIISLIAKKKDISETDALDMIDGIFIKMRNAIQHIVAFRSDIKKMREEIENGIPKEIVDTIKDFFKEKGINV